MVWLNVPKSLEIPGNPRKSWEISVSGFGENRGHPPPPPIRQTLASPFFSQTYPHRGGKQSPFWRCVTTSPQALSSPIPPSQLGSLDFSWLLGCPSLRDVGPTPSRRRLFPRRHAMGNAPPTPAARPPPPPLPTPLSPRGGGGATSLIRGAMLLISTIY